MKERQLFFDSGSIISQKILNEGMASNHLILDDWQMVRQVFAIPIGHIPPQFVFTKGLSLGSVPFVSREIQF